MLMQDNTVSIILPFFKAGRYVESIVNTLCAQSYKQFNLIVVDDGNGEGITDLIGALDASELKSSYIILKTSGSLGPARARNIGLEVVKTRFVSFLDADDFWAKEFLTVMFDSLTENNNGLACSSTTYLTESNKILNSSELPKKLGLNELLQTNPISLPGVMVDLSVVGEFRFPEVHHEDYALWLSLLKNNNYFICSQEKLVFVRRSTNSVSSNKFRAALWHMEVLSKYSNIKTGGRLILWGMYLLNTILKRTLYCYRPKLLPFVFLKQFVLSKRN